MTTPIEQARLEEEVLRFQHTVDHLTTRLEHTLLALALTFDAQAATRQRLTAHARRDDQLTDSVADLQTVAEQYRHLARTLTNGKR